MSKAAIVGSQPGFEWQEGERAGKHEQWARRKKGWETPKRATWSSESVAGTIFRGALFLSVSQCNPYFLGSCMKLIHAVFRSNELFMGAFVSEAPRDKYSYAESCHRSSKCCRIRLRFTLEWGKIPPKKVRLDKGVHVLQALRVIRTSESMDVSRTQLVRGDGWGVVGGSFFRCRKQRDWGLMYKYQSEN